MLSIMLAFLTHTYGFKRIAISSNFIVLKETAIYLKLYKLRYKNVGYKNDDIQQLINATSDKKIIKTVGYKLTKVYKNSCEIALYKMELYLYTSVKIINK